MIERPRILIVEDDVDLTEQVARFLQRRNMHVAVATSHEMARHQLAVGLFDVALIDVRLGARDQDGHDLCAYVHKHYPGTGTVIWTGFPDLEWEEQLASEGLHDYLEKPVDPVRLLRTIRRIVALRRSRRAQEMDWYRTAVSAATHRLGNDIEQALAGIDQTLRDASELGDEHRARLRQARGAIVRVAHLLRDLREWSRSDLIQGRSEELSLRAVMDQVRQDLAIDPDRPAQLTVEGDCDVMVDGKPTALRWVLGAIAATLVDRTGGGAATEGVRLLVNAAHGVATVRAAIPRNSAGDLRDAMIFRPYVEHVPGPGDASIKLAAAKFIAEMWQGRLTLEDAGDGEPTLRLDLPSSEAIAEGKEQ